MFSSLVKQQLMIFKEFMDEIPFVKVAEDNNVRVQVCLLHIQYLISKCTLYLVHLCLQ